MPMCTRVGSFYPGNSGRVQSPVNGTIVAFKVRAQGPTTLRFRLVRLRDVAPDHRTGAAKFVANSRLVTVHAPIP